MFGFGGLYNIPGEILLDYCVVFDFFAKSRKQGSKSTSEEFIMVFANAMGLWLGKWNGGLFLYRKMVLLVFHDKGIDCCL